MALTDGSRNKVLLASIAIAVSGAIWGVYWIPLRELDSNGITASWTSFLTFGATGIFFAVAFLVQWMKTGRLPWGVLLTGVLSGTCVIFYAVALVVTEIVKTVLLFYMTPVWSTILGRILLNENITPFRICAVVLGLTGLFVILGVADGIPRLSNLGDLLALASGLLWSYATVRIRDDDKAAVWEQVGGFYLGGALASVLFIFLPIHGLDQAPTLEIVIESSFWLLVFVVAYLPSLFLVFWGAQILSPARVGILMMSEIIFGVTSAAWLSGEPFGWTQIIGITLIFGAAVIDVSDRLFDQSNR